MLKSSLITPHTQGNGMYTPPAIHHGNVLKQLNFNVTMDTNNNISDKQIFSISGKSNSPDESENSLQTLANKSLFGNESDNTTINNSRSPMRSPGISPIRRIASPISKPAPSLSQEFAKALLNSPPSTPSPSDFNNSRLALGAMSIQRQFEDYEPLSPRKACPPAPSKAGRKRPQDYETTVSSPIVRDTSKLQYVNSRGERVNFTTAPMPGARGDYCQAYRVAKSDGELVPGVSNDQLLIKSYHEQGKNHAGRELHAFINNSLSQYDQLKAIGFPVAEIYNRATVTTDNFFIVEYIPEAFPEIANVKDIDFMDEELKSCLDQLKTMFKMAQDHNIALDLRKINVRIKEGKVILIDLMEDPSDKWYMIVKKNLNSFADCRQKEPNPVIFNYLDPR